MKKLSKKHFRATLFAGILSISVVRLLIAVWFSERLHVKMIDESVSWHSNMCPNVNDHTG